MTNKPRHEPLDISGVRRRSIADLARKVSKEDLAAVMEPTPALRQFLGSLPGVLAGREFRDFLDAVTGRRAAGQPVLVMFGGHVVKCGLVPLLTDLMERGYVSALATHGAGAIHDVEMALFGRTSEEVADGLMDGSFGMVRETGDFFLRALESGSEEGLGELLGRCLVETDRKAAHSSLLGTAYRLRAPLTVHVAIGTDIVHQHPGLSAGALGEASYRDFLVLCRVLSGMAGGGVVINLGSAVLMPEVFLKALTVVRNLGHPVHDLVTANFDMLRHYRPRVNVVERPTRNGGRGFEFTGHHEIMVPLLHIGLRCWAELDAGPGAGEEKRD